MKTIRICYVDFWENFDPDAFGFSTILRKKYNVIIDCNNPDYIIYSVFGCKHLEYKNAIKIFYTGECQSPNFNECDYAIGFDYITFDDRYLRWPLSALSYKNNNNYFSIKKSDRSKFCCMVVSNNSNAMKERYTFFLELSKYKKVDSGGRAFNNIGYAVANKLEFLSKYKFNLCFENRIYPGYCTEKIVESFAAGCIPIYLGDPKIGLQFNEDAFINVAKFKNFNDAIKKIIEIDNNENLRKDMLSKSILKKPIEDNLEIFLMHIFDQNLIEARRRCSKFFPSDSACSNSKNNCKTRDSHFIFLLKKLKSFIRKII